MEIREEEQRKTEWALYVTGACLGGFVLVLYLCDRMLPFQLEKLFLPCVFWKITGFYCPGCGGTRAVSAFLQGKWALSFLYHPLVPYSCILYAWYMVSRSIQYASRYKIKIGMHYRHAYLWTALGFVAVNFLVKNAALLFFRQDILKMLQQYL